MPRLFSYGSNNPTQLAERLGHPVEGKAAYAKGWMRVFRGFSSRWEGSVATLVKNADSTTYGYVADVSEEDLDTLDRYEGARYARTKITVYSEDHKKLTAVAYLRVGDEPFAERPSRPYLQAVAKTIGTFWEGDHGPITWQKIPVR